VFVPIDFLARLALASVRQALAHSRTLVGVSLATSNPISFCLRLSSFFFAGLFNIPHVLLDLLDRLLEVECPLEEAKMLLMRLVSETEPRLELSRVIFAQPKNDDAVKLRLGKFFDLRLPIEICLSEVGDLNLVARLQIEYDASVLEGSERLTRTLRTFTGVDEHVTIERPGDKPLSRHDSLLCRDVTHIVVCEERKASNSSIRSPLIFRELRKNFHATGLVVRHCSFDQRLDERVGIMSCLPGSFEHVSVFVFRRHQNADEVIVIDLDEAVAPATTLKQCDRTLHKEASGPADEGRTLVHNFERVRDARDRDEVAVFFYEV